MKIMHWLAPFAICLLAYPVHADWVRYYRPAKVICAKVPVPAVPREPGDPADSVPGFLLKGVMDRAEYRSSIEYFLDGGPVVPLVADRITVQLDDGFASGFSILAYVDNQTVLSLRSQDPALISHLTSGTEDLRTEVDFVAQLCVQGQDFDMKCQATFFDSCTDWKGLECRSSVW